MPERFRAGLDAARLEVVTLAQRRAVVQVVVPDAGASQTYASLMTSLYAGLGLPASDVLLYLAIREAAQTCPQPLNLW